MYIDMNYAIHCVAPTFHVHICHKVHVYFVDLIWYSIGFVGEQLRNYKVVVSTVYAVELGRTARMLQFTSETRAWC